jgi:hypothetical protein
MEINPLIQVIISLIILLLMGYIGYNIYLIELQNMFQGENDIRKEVSILSGTYDFSNSEVRYSTQNKSQLNYKNIKPSINQEGGAEYSYNFWLFIDQEKLQTSSSGVENKDYILFLKGEKNLYASDKFNYNCANVDKAYNPVIITKNPLVRLSGDGKKIAVEYNNIYTADSFQQSASYKSCNEINSKNWNERNKKMLGIYDIEFNNKWFMVTIVMKEVADSNNVLSINKASCKMYINGVKLLDKKVETKYMNNIYSATFKNNSSPFYINPNIDTSFIDAAKTPFGKPTKENQIKIADIKYYNYAINEDIIASLSNKGFNTEIAVTATNDNKLAKYSMVSVEDMEYNKIREL